MLWIYVGAGAGGGLLLILIVVVIAVVVTKNKNKKKTQNATSEEIELNGKHGTGYANSGSIRSSIDINRNRDTHASTNYVGIGRNFDEI